MTTFAFVTQSIDKVNEAERILGVKLERVHIDLPEIQAVEVEEVAANKAKYAYKALGKRPVMIEDTGLFFEAWGGLPGALIKWFIKYASIDGLCKMMNGFPNKSAWAETIVATYDGQLQTFRGKVIGRIALSPTGEEGFGWDKLFIPDGADKTFAEMSAKEKDRYSMRRLALEAMAIHYSYVLNANNV